MHRNLEPLRSFLADAALDGYLLDADGADPNQRYLSGFDAPDPFHTVWTTGGEAHLLVSELEYGRAREEADGTAVKQSAYDYQEHRRSYGTHEGTVRTLAAFLRDHDVERVGVPARFPAGTADGLREQGIAVTVDTEGVLETVRARKTDQELAHIRETQRANEAAMRTAEAMLARADERDGQLVLEGEPLTSERIKTAIEITLLEHGCALDDTIVAAGADGADPHDRGSGPIPANEPVVIDIFPRDKATRYHADMTRTFVPGSPDPTVEERYELTHEAYEAALETIQPGVTGETVHDAVCDVYEAAGHETLRSDPGTETGFIHGTGHGVGLEIHEPPRLSLGGDELETGHVVTVEPGLYDPAVGGIRLEDLVVVRADGPEILTEYPMAIQPQDRT